jgi:hypothetical protein
MIDGMGRVFNGPDLEDLRVPVEVETHVAKSWPGKRMLYGATLKLLRTPLKGRSGLCRPLRA